jgi:TusA-related sulfurtransferase/uncharacterized OsmC-like protein
MPVLPDPSAVCDGGDLDCGSGLLLIIRNAFKPLDPGNVLEVRSREPSVGVDLPAWCRMVGHGLLGSEEGDSGTTRYFIRKKGDDDALAKDLEEARRFAWKVRVRWTEGMKARAFVRNHAFDIGQPASFDTEDVAPSAIEHLLAALAGCLAVGFQWRASKANVQIFNLEVSASATADNILVFLGVEDQGHPGLARVEGHLFVDADATPARLQEIWDDTCARSPLLASLTRCVPVSIDLRTS